MKIWIVIVLLIMGGFRDDPPWVVSILDRCENYRAIVEMVNEERGYNLDENLILSIYAVESMCNPSAISSDRHNSVGLGQVTPEEWTGTKEQLLDPIFNARVTGWLMKTGLDRVDGDVRLALKGYNCGWEPKNPTCGDDYAQEVMQYWYPRFLILETIETGRLCINDFCLEG